jgi:hypothetical protein
MRLAGVTLNSFLRIGLIALVFSILAKQIAVKLPLPAGLQAAIGAA